MSPAATMLNTLDMQDILDKLDIPLWGKQPAAETGLFFQNPMRHSKIWLLLSSKITDKNSQAFQVYTGMLKVLDLAPERVSCAWIKNRAVAQMNHNTKNITDKNNNIAASIYKTLNTWKPENVLILGHSLWGVSQQSQMSQESQKSPTSQDHSPRYFSSYHPQELAETPMLKRETYKLLLSLKEILNRGVLGA